MTVNDDLRYHYENTTDQPGTRVDQFGATLVSTRIPLIELNSSYGTSLLRDRETLVGTGAVASDASGEIKVSTGATTSSSAKLESAARGRYVPGYGAEMGIGIRVPTPPTGDQEATWGGLSDGDTDGFYFGVDATGVFCAYKRAGVENKTYQTDWNIDSLNGSGQSGITLDLSVGYIFQIKFTWYGYGQILFGVVALDNRSYQSFTPIHSIRVKGSSSITTPNLKPQVNSLNGTTASNFDVYVGGRSYSIVGDFTPKFRHTTEWRGSVATSTTAVPLISFRFKDGFKDRNVKFADVQMIPATEPVVFDIRLDPTTLTGASWGTPTSHTASETALESDTSATAVSGGVLIFSGLSAAGAANKFSILASNGSDIDLPEGSVLTLCARTLSGTGTVLSHLDMIEEW